MRTVATYSIKGGVGKTSAAVNLGALAARDGRRIAIGSYLGKGKTFDRAIAEFSERYADQNELDHGMLTDAAKSGRIEIETDLT